MISLRMHNNMRQKHIFQVLITLLCFSNLNIFAQKTYQYPIAAKDTTSNVYFDTTIYDPSVDGRFK